LYFPIFFSAPVSASNVYYLNQNSPEFPGEGKAKDYSLKQRVVDLLDFPANFDSQKDRSGRIGGSVLQEMDYQNMGGNKSKSFLM